MNNASYEPGTETQSMAEQNGSNGPMQSRQIFREHAMQHYMQKNEQTIKIKTISPIVFTCCWIILTLIILAGFLVWSVPVPNYAETLAIAQPAQNGKTSTLLAFFPTSARQYLQSGQTIQISGNTPQNTLTGHITTIDPQALGPLALGTRYQLQSDIVHLLPSTDFYVATITLTQPIPVPGDISTRLTLRYQQGTSRALSLFLNLNY